MWFIKSRKVQVALVSIIAVVSSKWGLEVSEETLNQIIALAIALILGIAHEDNGSKKVLKP